MAKFWFISAPLLSHTDWGGFLKTAKLLQQSGHTVIWVSQDKLRHFIQNEGLSFESVEETGWLWPPPPLPDISELFPQEAMNLRYKRALDTWLSEDIVSRATQCLVALARKIGKPDLIVTDPFLSASALFSELIEVHMVVCGWPAQVAFDETMLFPIQRTLGTDSQQRISRLCSHFDIDGINFSKGATPSIISPDLHVCYFTEHWYIAESESLLPQNIFVGGEPNIPHGPVPDWLEQIPDDVPLGLVTLGSIFTGDLGFFSWGAQAVAKAGLLPIVVIGNNPITPARKAELIAALPRGTRLLNWVPFDHILPRVKLILHHGGMGTTHYAVVHGIPQIVVPHAADQRVQARRVAQAKVGINLTSLDVKQGMLMEGALALVNDERVKENAVKLSNDMAALGGPKRAAEAIETKL